MEPPLSMRDVFITKSMPDVQMLSHGQGRS